MPRTPAIPVAEYLRMSTEHQQYSTANQALAILRYAQSHNMAIVRTYADHGKSGLGLTKRPGLKQLLRDALAPDIEFRAVLVYDVSRWGRFQNPDEAAAYEYMLLQGNVKVHYCAEPFTNDGSLASAILKTLKRGMAGEYSRELSAKVWAGNRRIAELGFHIGGHAGYGLRRQLIGKGDTAKQIMNQGERKNLQSEHVILVPGPPEELEVIEQIYAMFIEGSLSELEIARELNARNIPWMNARPWTRLCVRHILTNPKYIGASVYNRISKKLQTKEIRNPRNEWIWCADAFEPVVPLPRFELAREIFLERYRVRTSEEMLDGLKAIVEKQGRITERLIDETENIPCAGAYVNRFGSLRTAYSLIGWKSDHQAKLLKIRRLLCQCQKEMVAMACEALSDYPPAVVQHKNTYRCITPSGVSFSVTATRSTKPIKSVVPYWYVYSSIPVQLHVVGRLTPDNDRLLDFFIFPEGVLKHNRLTLGTINAHALGHLRFENLSILRALFQSSDVERLATENQELPCLSTDIAMEARPHAILSEIRSHIRQMIADEDFRTLLRAENSQLIPDVAHHQREDVPESVALVVGTTYISRLLSNNQVRRFLSRKYSCLFGHLESLKLSLEAN